MRAFAQGGLLATLLLVMAVAGCTASHYRKSADREAYRLIREKSPLVRNMDPRFTIEQTNTSTLAGFPTVTNVEEFLGTAGERERGAPILKLEDSLGLAIQYSRNYQ